MAGRHRSNGVWAGTTFRTHRAPSRNRKDYRGRHRWGFIAALTGRPRVGEIQRKNAAPGLFHLVPDVWDRPRGTARVNRYGGRYGSWT